MGSDRGTAQKYTAKQAESFLRKHGITVGNESKGYYQSMGLYCLYLVDCMKQAEQIEDGLFFDESEVEILLRNMEEAKDAMEYYRKQLLMDYSSFDAAETISLKGCRLENGKIVGDEQAAEQIARKWVLNYFKGEGNAFMFEVGNYILFLLNKGFEYLW